MPGLVQENSVRIEQGQVLAAQQLHALEFLAAPVMELQNKIDEEISRNPLLEPGPDPDENNEPDEFTDPDENMIHSGPDAVSRDEDSINEDRDGFMESMEKVIENGEPFWDDGPDRTSDDDPHDRTSIQDAEERRTYLFNSVAAKGPSLQELLLQQLRCTECPDDIRNAAVEVIGSIDEQGYLRTADGDIAQSVSCSLSVAERARELVQSFDPPGIGARDVRESLQLQLRRKGLQNSPEAVLVRDHLDDLARNRLPQIAKAMEISVETLNGLIASVRKLNPYPAAGFASTESHAPYIEPECSVVPDEGDFKVIPNRESFPRFHISKRYLRMLDDPFVSEDDKKFIREKLASARELLSSLDRRESTIIRIAGQIVSEQHDFFVKGKSALHPLTQNEIADKLNIHETTVSRAIAGKYMQTPYGIMAFKDFFSGGYTGDNGEDVSAGAIRNIIRETVAGEDPEKPLSDSSIEKVLRSRGYAVARRTIAKYREEMGILSSQMRKQYT